MTTKQYYENYWGHRQEISHLYEEWIPPRISVAEQALTETSVERLLDVGCGNGILGRILASEGNRPEYIAGVDISESALKLADDHYDDLYCADVEDKSPPTNGDRYDAVVCLETLEHVLDPKNMLTGLREVVAPDGILILSVPNIAYITYRVQYARGDVANETLTGDGVEHIHQFTKERIEALVESSGFAINDLIGVNDSGSRVKKYASQRYPKLFASGFVVIASPVPYF
jgi:2-polyprenyl-3-methyl-5-hydroxy-6-metoxy-1,4-benzoquinol methylase